MQPTELEEARRLFEQAESETDPERKFSFFEEALDLTDDFATDNPGSPHLVLAKNLRKSNLRILLAQLINMRRLEIDVWFRYIHLFLLRVNPEVESILSADPTLKESFRKFIDLWRDELVAALERTK